jgi:hypothetical protein
LESGEICADFTGGNVKGRNCLADLGENLGDNRGREN